METSILRHKLTFCGIYAINLTYCKIYAWGAADLFEVPFFVHSPSEMSRLQLRLPPSLLKRLQAQAAERGLPVSTFARLQLLAWIDNPASILTAIKPKE